MSKRFGRNQKRRMREQLAEATTRANRLDYQLYESRKLGERNAEIVRDTAEVLGNYFMTLDPHRVEVQTLDRSLEHWRVPVFDQTRAPSPGTFMEVVLPILRSSELRGDISSHIHVGFYIGTHRAATAIKPESLLLYSEGRAVRYLTEAIAPELAKHLLKSMYRTKTIRLEGIHDPEDPA